jgi:hypothetical protein
LLIGSSEYFVGEYIDLIGALRVEDGRWHRVTMAYDGNSISMYVDGSLDLQSPIANGPGTGTPFSSLNTALTSLRVGDSAQGEQFIGDITSISIWNVALTSDQIANPAASGLPTRRFVFAGGLTNAGPFVDQINPANTLNFVGR